jgi:hypothetical protein
MLQDHGVDFLKHRFEPTIQILRGFNVFLVLSPYYEKRKDQLGLGLGWRDDECKWLNVSASLKGFDHNLSLGETPAGPDRDPYGKIPFVFEANGRWETDWLRARIHGQLDTRGNHYLDWPDSVQYVWDKDFDQGSAWGRMELQPFKGLWLGSRFSFNQSRSVTRWPDHDAVTYDTLVNRWIEPFVAISPSERLCFQAQYLWRAVERSMDSVTYRSRVDVYSLISTWNPIDWLVVSAGWQRSFRERWNNDTLINEPYRNEPGARQNRLLFGLEIRAGSGLMFSIKEGIELDQAPVRTFKNYHNHTYVLLHMPLGWLMDRRSNDEERRPTIDYE